MPSRAISTPALSTSLRSREPSMRTGLVLLLMWVDLARRRERCEPVERAARTGHRHVPHPATGLFAQPDLIISSSSKSVPSNRTMSARSAERAPRRSASHSRGCRGGASRVGSPPDRPFRRPRCRSQARVSRDRAAPCRAPETASFRSRLQPGSGHPRGARPSPPAEAAASDYPRWRLGQGPAPKSERHGARAATTARRRDRSPRWSGQPWRSGSAARIAAREQAWRAAAGRCRGGVDEDRLIAIHESK